MVEFGGNIGLAGVACAAKFGAVLLAVLLEVAPPNIVLPEVFPEVVLGLPNNEPGVPELFVAAVLLF